MKGPSFQERHTKGQNVHIIQATILRHLPGILSIPLVNTAYFTFLLPFHEVPSHESTAFYTPSHYWASLCHLILPWVPLCQHHTIFCYTSISAVPAPHLSISIHLATCTILYLELPYLIFEHDFEFILSLSIRSYFNLGHGHRTELLICFNFEQFDRILSTTWALNFEHAFWVTYSSTTRVNDFDMSTHWARIYTALMSIIGFIKYLLSVTLLYRVSHWEQELYHEH
jgi:hypothetical protein